MEACVFWDKVLSLIAEGVCGCDQMLDEVPIEFVDDSVTELLLCADQKGEMMQWLRCALLLGDAAAASLCLSGNGTGISESSIPFII